MQDLRVRFGIILAAALLPILVFAIIQSFYDYKSDNEVRDDILHNRALNAASEVVDTLEVAKSILRITGHTVDVSSGCEAQLTAIMDVSQGLESLTITDPEGNPICSTRARQTAAKGFNRKGILSAKRPFYTTTHASKNSAKQEAVEVIVTYGVFEAGVLKKAVHAGFMLEDLRALTDKTQLDDGTRIAIINRRGEYVVGQSRRPTKGQMGWVEVVNNEGQFEGQVKDNKGKARNVFVVESGTEGLYVAMSRPDSSLLSWSQLNPFSSIIVPVLAWLFGFVAIWLATDRLILTHLRKMKRVALQFANGNLDERIGELKDSPQSIHTLGANFDFMADRLSQRELELSDSLDEKETLLREIHHRVKNNLQIIISLLNMQERKLKDKEGLMAIQETRSRINAIALVHRGLYESRDLRYVKMQTFLDRLMGELSLALGLEDRKISVSTIANCEPMEADTAIPVALFIVEALTNSVKHGVSKGGHITITLLQDLTNLTVTISDNGKRGKQIDTTRSGTGTKLIKGFARQLGGEIRREHNDAGYEVTLEFKLRKETI